MGLALHMVREGRARMLLRQLGLQEPTEEQLEDTKQALKDEYEEALSRAAAAIRYLESSSDQA